MDALEFDRIVLPKRQKKLPKSLSKSEIRSMFATTANLKHRMILYILYSGGLRVGELVELKIEDIDLEQQTIRIVQGKGKKDRITIISKYVGRYHSIWINTSPRNTFSMVSNISDIRLAVFEMLFLKRHNVRRSKSM